MPDGTTPASVVDDLLAKASSSLTCNAKASRAADDVSHSSFPPVTVHVVQTRGTPDRQMIWDRLALAIQQADIGHVLVVTRCLTTLREACQHDLHGSPTILIDGLDPFADLTKPCGVHSRLFVTELGVETAPSVRQLVGELRGAHDRRAAASASRDTEPNTADLERSVPAHSRAQTDHAAMLSEDLGPAAAHSEVLTALGLDDAPDSHRDAPRETALPAPMTRLYR